MKVHEKVMPSSRMEKTINSTKRLLRGTWKASDRKPSLPPCSAWEGPPQSWELVSRSNQESMHQTPRAGLTTGTRMDKGREAFKEA